MEIGVILYFTSKISLSYLSNWFLLKVKCNELTSWYELWDNGISGSDNYRLGSIVRASVSGGDTEDSCE